MFEYIKEELYLLQILFSEFTYLQILQDPTFRRRGKIFFMTSF